MDWKNLGNGALSSLSTGLIGGAVNGFMDRLFNGSPSKQLDRQLAYNREIMDYQQKLNREQFDYEYEKQSPKAIREQLEKAGLNPALMYGGSSASGIQASIDGVGLSSMSNPHVAAQGTANPLAISQLHVMDAQAQDLEASAKLKQSQANQIDELLPGTKELLSQQGLSERNKARILGVNADIDEILKSDSIENRRVLFDTAVHDLRSLILDNQMKQFTQSKQEEQYNLGIAEMFVRMALTASEINLNEANVTLTNAKVRETLQNVGVLKVLRSKLLYEVAQGKVNAETMKDQVASHLDLNEAQKEYYDVMGSEALNYGSTGLGLLINLVGLGIFAKSSGVLKPKPRKIGF